MNLVISNLGGFTTGFFVSIIHKNVSNPSYRDIWETSLFVSDKIKTKAFPPSCCLPNQPPNPTVTFIKLRYNLHTIKIHQLKYAIQFTYFLKIMNKESTSHYKEKGENMKKTK